MRSLLRIVVLGSILLSVGCFTLQPGTAKYERDGTRYGVTKGTFRIRWWNYYERGRSFSDGQYWTEAERDFRRALAGRSKDQWWSRTYGLHLLDEYFPNRELGIVLFNEGRLEEAIRSLELSLSQQYSARTAYYLDRARAKRIAEQRLDTSPPRIEISAPTSHRTVGTTHVEIVGVARDDTFVSEVSISGERCLKKVSLPEMPFSKSILLSPGANTIVVSARDLSGKIATTEISVECDVDGPTMSFDSPMVLPGTVRGMVSDSSGVKAVSIAGKEVALEPVAEGIMRFSASLKGEELHPPLTYASEDFLGNVTSGMIIPDVIAARTSLPKCVFAANAAEVLSLGEHLFRLIRVGDVVMLARADAVSLEEPPSAKFLSPVGTEKRRYWSEEIVVSVQLTTGAFPIKTAEINGQPLSGLLPRGKIQTFTRRILLKRPGENEVCVTVEDSQGQRSKARVTVERMLTQIEQISERLSVAFLGFVWDGSNSQRFDEVIAFENALTELLGERKRFCVLDRARINETLEEQDLAVPLASNQQASASGTVVPVELMLIGKARRDAETLHVVFRAVSVETSLVMGYIDVAGPANTLSDIDQLARDMAIRLEQEFPRVQGLVSQIKSAERVMTTLSKPDGVQWGMKCIVYQKGKPTPDPYTGIMQDGDVNILGRGFLDDVKQTVSTVTLDRAATKDIGVKDFVITK